LEWVGDIPSDWNVEPFFKVMPQSGRSNSGLTEVNLLSLSYGQIIRKDIDSNDGLLPASFETYQIVEPGDIVFRFTDLQNDKRSLRSALVRERGIITSAYLAVSPKACLPSYADFLMRSYDTTKVFYSFGGGVRQSLTYSDVKRLPVLVPPIETQRAIVDFLSRETEQIDALIGKQERLVDVLDERRSAMISHAVTRGLDPSAPTKDSGVEWLGRVPAAWTVKALPRYMLGRVDYRGATPTKREDGVLLITARNVKAGYIDYDTSKEFVAEDEYAEIMSRGTPQVGDILMTMEAPLGNFAAVDRPHIALAQRIVKFRASSEALSSFLVYALNSATFQAQLVSKATGSTALGLKASKLIELRLAMPPVAEQSLIAQHLDDKTAKIDALIEKAKAMNVVLRERRSALISAAVTGKIDVTKRIEGAA